MEDKRTVRKKGGSDKRKRDSVVSIRLDGEERARALELADKSGLALGAFARAAMFGATGLRAKRRPTADREALLRVLGELGRVGNNVNQIAHRLNAGQQADADEVRRACREVVAAMDLVREALGQPSSGPTTRPPHDNQRQQPGGS